MERARQAAANFLSGDGKHKTVVDEDVRASVTEEHIHPHRHENLTTAIDKEVHQHHHHTTVQPVKHKETLPEKHTHNIIPVEHKTFHHGNERDLKDKLQRDAAQYQSSSLTHETTHSTAAMPVLTGERIYHHVHEHVQPIVQKETIVQEVIHTTVPIHETHHAEAVHHGTSTLPIKTLEEWKTDGGVLGGRASTILGETDGCPQPYNKDLQSQQLGADRDMHPSMKERLTGTAGSTGATERGNLTGDRTHLGDRTNLVGSRTTGTGTNMGTQRVGEDISGTDGTGNLGSSTGRTENLTSTTGRGTGMSSGRGENLQTGTTRSSDMSGNRMGRPLSGSDEGKNYSLGSGTGAAGVTGATGSEASPRAAQTGTERTTRVPDSLGVRSGSQKQPRKASLVDKLNPFKDADGDGKKGIMD